MAKKIRQPVNKKEFVKLLDFYQGIGKPYDYVRSGHSMLIRIGTIEYYCNNIPKCVKDKKTGKKKLNNRKPLPKEEIWFIGHVKKHIIDSGKHLKIKPNYRNVEKIKFIDYNDNVVSGEHFKKAYMLDIKSAYWDSALMEGFITPEIYTKGQDMDKGVRLASLGTFAKVEHIWHFDGKEEIKLDDVAPEYPHIFFNAANRIYKCMAACKKELGDSFLFYWTDCVYVKNKFAADIAAKVIRKHGYNNTLEISEYCTRREECFMVKKPGKEIKEYPFDLR